jgi:DNA repair exonuclease SbcCD nuclease subunit
MSIAFMADMHLGCQQYGLKERTEDFYKAVDVAFDTIIANDTIKAVIIGGDAFDMAKPPAEAVKRLQSCVSKAIAAGKPVYGIDGNHDMSEGKWLSVCGVIPLTTVPTEICGLRVVGIPSCRTPVFYGHITDMVNDGVKADILVMHDAVAELSNFKGTELSGESIADAIKPIGIKTVLMGHIHEPGSKNIKGVVFTYPGSTEMKSMDEPNQKGYIILDKDMNMERVFINTRKVNIKYIKTSEDIDTYTPELDALNIIFIDSTVPQGVSRIETICHTHEAMCRIVSYKSETETKINSIDRENAITSLSDAVEAYFDKNSDEYSLVVKLLDCPNNVKAVIDEYIKSKQA